MRTKIKFNFTININDKKNNLIIKSILKEKEIVCILLKLISANIKYKNLIYHRHQTVSSKRFKFFDHVLIHFFLFASSQEQPCKCSSKTKKKKW